MKLLRVGAPGQEKPAILDADGKARDLSSVISDIAGDALLPESLAKIAAIDPSTLRVLEEGRIGPCVGSVGKFICIGLNYSDHAAESGLDVPKEPVIFMKATSAICGPNDTVLIPRKSVKTDWEVELGVVIGKGGVYIDEADALDHIVGYCVVNDVSEREFQIERGGTWDKGKGCDTFGPIGPWLVTRDEIPDPQRLFIWLDVNGERMQTGNTRTMIFPVAKLVSYVSQFMTLNPGDVITTGTPPGVGMGRRDAQGQPAPRFLKKGDVMTMSIQGLGEQRQRIVPFRA